MMKRIHPLAILLYSCAFPATLLAQAPIADNKLNAASPVALSADTVIELLRDPKIIDDKKQESLRNTSFLDKHIKELIEYFEQKNTSDIVRASLIRHLYAHENGCKIITSHALKPKTSEAYFFSLSDQVSLLTFRVNQNPQLSSAFSKVLEKGLFHSNPKIQQHCWKQVGHTNTAIKYLKRCLQEKDYSQFNRRSLVVRQPQKFGCA